MSGGLGGDNEDFAAGFTDGGEEALQGFQVGHAERAPVAAEVWVGWLNGWMDGLGRGEGRGTLWAFTERHKAGWKDVQTTQRKE